MSPERPAAPWRPEEVLLLRLRIAGSDQPAHKRCSRAQTLSFRHCATRLLASSGFFRRSHALIAILPDAGVREGAGEAQGER